MKQWSTLKKLIWLYAAKLKGGAQATIETITGNLPLVLRNAIQHSIKSLTRYGLCTQADTPTPSAPVDIKCNNGALKIRHESGLPSGYTLLDEVHNNSNTIVNTGILDDVDDLRIELRVKPSTGSWYIAQSRASSNGPIYGISGSGTGKTILFNCGSASSLSSGIVRDASHTYTVIGEHKNGVISLYVKDETTGAEDTKTGTYATADFTAATTQIGIWSNGVNNALLGNAVYHLRIYKSGVLVADHVPCQYNNENGFYDFVSGSFKGATNGSIFAGTAVTDPVEVYVDGTPEVLTIGNQTASVQNLFGVGDYADTQELIGGVVKRNVGIKVFDGTESFSKTGAIYIHSVADKATTKSPVLCSHFAYFDGTTSGAADGDIITHTNTNLYFKNSTTATLEAWQSFLAAQYAAGTPVIVLYPLAEATTESVAGQSLSTVEGTNVVSVTAEVSPAALSCEYYATE